MQVTKLRIANDNGLVPAGRYFARIAEALRAANERAAAVVDIYEEQTRAADVRTRKTASPVPSRSPAATRSAPTLPRAHVRSLKRGEPIPPGGARFAQTGCGRR